TRSVTMAWALRSVTPTMAARSRTRTPGSWAMHSSARAWLVRKLQLPIRTPYHDFQKLIACFGAQVYGAHQVRGGCRRSVATSGKKGTTMELLVLAIVVIVAFGLYRFWRARAAH